MTHDPLPRLLLGAHAPTAVRLRVTVDLDCHCGQTLSVPVVEVDDTNGIHLDHGFIAEHVAGHDENGGE